MEPETEIPEGCKKIFLAKIFVDIIKVRWKKKYKEKRVVEMVYKEYSEKDPESYFMKCLKRKLGLGKDQEEFKITEIQKIKYINYSLPNIK